MKLNIFKDSKKSMIFLVTVLSVMSSNLAWATTADVKEKINEAADALKKGVDKCGDKMEDIQQYLHNHDFKGVIKDYVSSGPATVFGVTLNGHKRAIVVKPGERIEGTLKYKLDTDRCKDIKYHRLLLGFKDVGPQTTVGVGIGFLADKENEGNFTLIAPQKPGVYQIRFRSVENYTETEAVKHWKDEHGNEPSLRKTVGIVVVKS